MVLFLLMPEVYASPSLKQTNDCLPEDPFFEIQNGEEQIVFNGYNSNVECLNLNWSDQKTEGKTWFRVYPSLIKDAPLLFIINGGPGLPSSTFWYRSLLKLRDKYTVVQFNQRGVRNSSMKFDDMLKPHLIGTDSIISDLRTFKKLYGANKPSTIIGHSFGSSVAQKFAALYPDEVENLVLTGVGYKLEWVIDSINNLKSLFFNLDAMLDLVFDEDALAFKGVPEFQEKIQLRIENSEFKLDNGEIVPSVFILRSISSHIISLNFDKKLTREFLQRLAVSKSEDRFIINNMYSSRANWIINEVIVCAEGIMPNIQSVREDFRTHIAQVCKDILNQNTYQKDKEFKLKDVKAKTIIIAGSADETMSVDSATKLSQEINGSRLEVINGLPHNPGGAFDAVVYPFIKEFLGIDDKAISYDK